MKPYRGLSVFRLENPVNQKELKARVGANRGGE
jgi:hypothetical protein